MRRGQVRNFMQTIYLNNAATSWPKPKEVGRAMEKALRSLPGSGNRGGIKSFDVFAQVRRELALVFGVSAPEQIALGCSATWGLNQGIFGYPLEKGDCVLTTRAEHNSVLRPLHVLKKKGIRVVSLPVGEDGRVSEESWEKGHRTFHPKLSILTHGSNVTGAVHDGERFAGITREYGSELLLDVSQTAGYISLELEKWGVAMAVFAGHKYLLGPQGTGGIYVRKDISLSPHIVGGTGVLGNLKEMPEQMPLHLEAGTGNEPSYYGLLAALLWRRDHPLDREKTDVLAESCRRRLEELGCEVIRPIGECTPVVSFTVPGYTPEETGDILRGSYDIICRVGLHCAPDILEDIRKPRGSVRLSFSRFSTKEELDIVLEAVEAMRESL